MLKAPFVSVCVALRNVLFQLNVSNGLRKQLLYDSVYCMQGKQPLLVAFNRGTMHRLHTGRLCKLKLS